MRGKRERLFECTYGVPGEERRVVFRAWTPVEAAAGVEEALQGAGIPLGGMITVRDARGRVVLQVSPRPFHQPGASGAA
jgi:hypothetical protein